MTVPREREEEEVEGGERLAPSVVLFRGARYYSGVGGRSVRSAERHV